MNSSLLLRSSRLLKDSFVCRQCRRWASQGRVFKEGDKVIVKKINHNEDDGWIFTLSTSQKIQSHKGFIPHQEIIGRRSGALVRSHKGAQFRVFEPSLAEYVTLSTRLVTPIYPDDANLMVNLLDLHPPTPEDTTYDDEPLQILEVGTGQGSLTLHIAKAIHGYNERARLKPLSNVTDIEPNLKNDKRKAILHTTDVVEKHAQHAEKIVKGFRHGQYASNVEFHVGTMEDFFRKITENTLGEDEKQPSSSPPMDSLSEIPSTISATTETSLPPPTSTYTPLQPSISPFLSHIIIDTPSAHNQIELACKYLLPGGTIITFNPSITQIGECTERIKRLNIPLDQETVLELGQNMSGGKVWDVRAITPRIEERRMELARLKAAKRMATESEGESESESRVEVDALSNVEAVEEEAAKKAVEEQKFVMVCRPKVGKMIIGGGFVGVWRKIAD
ncbi:tRNA (adenine-N(1)-)-methyltransferase [Venturia nashicola]|nr:tRNA (adenine-N(1)-)-methyltransferase [Venturia nashicola]